MTRFRAWLAYEKAFQLSSRIFDFSKTFPKEERYSLTDQIRRSSRSVCANLAESHAKRTYRLYFLMKLTDAMAENNETMCWLDFAFRAEYMDEQIYKQFMGEADEVNKLLGFMLRHPEKFLHRELYT